MSSFYIYLKQLIPSKQSGNEIINLNKIYQKNKQCFYHNLTSAIHWYDLGQISELDDYSIFLKIYQHKK